MASNQSILGRFFTRNSSSEESRKTEYDGHQLSLPALVYRCVSFNFLKKVIDSGMNNVNERDQYRNTALHQAVRRQDIEVVKLLLQHGADCCAENSEGVTPVMLAVLLPSPVSADRCKMLRTLLDGSKEMCEARLQHINPCNKYTLCHYLAREGRLDMLTVAIESFEKLKDGKEKCQSWIDKRTGFEGPGAVHLAAAHNHIDVLEQLLAAGGSVDLDDEQYRTPLHHAAEYGRSQVIDFILEHATDYGSSAAYLLAKENAQDQMPVHTAARNGRLMSLRKLANACIKEDVDLDSKDENGRTVLSTACVMGHLDIVKWLLNNGDIGIKIREQVEIGDNEGRTAFYLAAMYGHMDIVKHLSSQGANTRTVCEKRTTPLMAVSQHCPPETAKQLISILLRAGVNPAASDGSNRTALHSAVRNNQSRVGGAIARRLLNSAKTTQERRRMCETKDVNGWSVLHLAAKRGHIGVLSALLQLRAENDVSQLLVDIESVTHEGQNVLHLAAQYGRSRIIRRIIRVLSGDMILKLVNKQDSSGLTPCHWASIEDHANVLELLLESGASPDSKDLNRCTPLHYAAERGSVHIAQVLLRYAPGIVNLQDVDETTPLLNACSSGHGNMVKLLLAHGAEFIGNKDGLSPLDIAAKCGHTEIVKELLSSEDWRYFLNNSEQLVAYTILKKTPRAMPTLLDCFAVPYTDGEGNKQIVNHLYYLYYQKCPEDLVEPLTEEQLASDPQHYVQQSRASLYHARQTLSSPVGRPDSLSSGLSLSFDDDVLPGRPDRSYSMPAALLQSIRTQQSRQGVPDWKPSRMSTPRQRSNTNPCTVTASNRSSRNRPTPGHTGTGSAPGTLRRQSNPASKARTVVQVAGMDTTDGDDATDGGWDEADFDSPGTSAQHSATPTSNGSARLSLDSISVFSNGSENGHDARLDTDADSEDDERTSAVEDIETVCSFALDSSPVSENVSVKSSTTRGKLSREPSIDWDNADTADGDGDEAGRKTPVPFTENDLLGSITSPRTTRKVSGNARRKFSVLREDSDTDPDERHTLDLSGAQTEFSRMTSRLSNRPSPASPPGEDEADGSSRDLGIPSQASQYARYGSRGSIHSNFDGPGGSTGMRYASEKAEISATDALIKYWKHDRSCCGNEPTLIEAIIECNRHELLLHPTIKEWADCKWQGYVKMMNYWYFALCIVFLALLLAFVTVNKQPLQDTDEGDNNNVSMGVENGTCFKNACNSSTFTAFPLSNGAGFTGLRTSLLTMCALLIVGEIAQMIRMRKRYFHYASNYLQWAIVIPSVVFVAPLTYTQPHPLQWMAGSVAVFLSWVNIILCVQWSTPLGIYVSMFYHILKSALRALILVVLFVFAFGFTFYILLSDKDAFSSVGQSLMKTVGMTVGEIELAETFLTATDSSSAEHFDEYSESHKILKYIVVLLFILILPTITQNLLIGMAAGEAADVKRNAVLQLATYQVETILEWEYSLPESFVTRMANFPVTKKTAEDNKSWKAWVVKFMTGVNSAEEVEQSGSPEVNDVLDRVDQLTDLSQAMMARLESQQLLLDNQSQRLDRLLHRQRKHYRHFKGNPNERSLDI
ncbi:transient receptor potential cation channel subfamily A member 1-like [Sycon ciliatum]|uniref:transient receptor potential cation channel subfamily A member 1-like n=1 Tax=Sycon ciliatum TaxID=27933 RepID=UPI0031F6CB7C